MRSTALLKKSLVPALGTVLAFAVSVLPAAATTPTSSGPAAYLVRDLISGVPSSANDDDSEPVQLTGLGNKAVFLASEPSSGQEVWVSDGSSGGTEMLADVCPGVCSSQSKILGVQRGLVYWVGATDDGFYAEPLQLWRSDGTRAGTFPLTDTATSNLLNQDTTAFAFTSRYLFFNACEPGTGCAIWRTDGTVAGTVRLASFTPISNGSWVILLAGAADRAYYVSRPNDANYELWTTDGTAAGTKRLRRFSTSSSYPDHLTAAGNRLFFLAPDGETGTELWTSDGTVAGTRSLTQFPDGYRFGPLGLWASGGRVYFTADDVTHGTELWRSDGTPAGTVRITDFGYHAPFGEYHTPDSFADLGGKVVFVADDGLHGQQVWATSGTPESTQPLSPLCDPAEPGCSQARLKLVRAGSRVLFTAGGSNAQELWSTDGTAGGTRMVQDLCPASCGGVLSILVAVPGGALFVGHEAPYPAPQSLWRSDGTAAGTRRLATPGPGVSLIQNYEGLEAAAGADGRIFFAAASSAYGQELWTADGTARGTRLVTDLARSDNGAEPYDLTALGDRLFFTGCAQGFDREIWQTSGSAESTQAVTAFGGSCFNSGAPYSLTVAGGQVFFVREPSSLGSEIWRGDGTAAGLRQVGVIAYPQRRASPLIPFGGSVYFLVQDESAHLSEVWKSDGTAAGTVEAFELPGLYPFRLSSTGQELLLAGFTDGGQELWISDGTAAGSRMLISGDIDLSRSQSSFVRVGAAVFFNVRAGENNEIWTTDGTAAGTRRIADLGFAFRTAWDLTAHQGALYFFVENGNDEPGLWRSDGTPAGTVRVRTFKNHEWLSQQTFLTSFNGALYFVADGDGSGGEVWKSDGTAAGTVLLRDIAPGSNDSRPFDLRVADGRLFFAANDGVHGAELWQTDGSTGGTRLVQDIAPEGLSAAPRDLTVAGGRLYFVANDGLTGPELWALPLGDAPAACQPSPTRLCLGGRYQVEVAWKDFQRNRGLGTAASLTPDTGYFWFFDPANVEVIVKVLDGRGLNGHEWVFYGALSNVEYTVTVTDLQTRLTRRYFNPSGNFASIGDTQAFGPLGAFSTAPAVAPAASIAKAEEHTDPAAATGTCQTGPQRLCLNSNRFAVEVAWKDFQGHTGKGQAVPLSGDTGYFWFFNASNVELVTKALDGTALNGKYWFFYGALSNVEYKITVTDTVTGTVKTYANPAGRFASVGDTGAF